LVRRVCRHCGAPHVPQAAELEIIRHAPSVAEQARFRKGAGCKACRGTGYHGRVGCFELLTVDEEIRRLVQDHALASAINEAARRGGMHSLRDDGLGKVGEGQTTLDEVIRVSVRAAF
jgi:type II secretory ATPase GspE/PulE/Tfp pilus assembly ATPase PilB-like protein